MSFKVQTNTCIDAKGWDSIKRKIYSFRSAISRNEETIDLLEKEMKEQRYQLTRLVAEKAKMKQLLLRLATNHSELARSIETEVFRIENESESTRSELATTGSRPSNIAIKPPVCSLFSQSIGIMKGIYEFITVIGQPIYRNSNVIETSHRCFIYFINRKIYSN